MRWCVCWSRWQCSARICACGRGSGGLAGSLLAPALALDHRLLLDVRVRRCQTLRVHLKPFVEVAPPPDEVHPYLRHRARTSDKIPLRRPRTSLLTALLLPPLLRTAARCTAAAATAAVSYCCTAYRRHHPQLGICLDLGPLPVGFQTVDNLRLIPYLRQWRSGGQASHGKGNKRHHLHSALLVQEVLC